MTNRLELNWKLDGLVDEQRYYCSETPFTSTTLPAPKTVLLNIDRTYVDTDVDEDKLYYVAVSSVKNGVEKVSEIKQISTNSDPLSNYVVSLLRFKNDFTDEKGNIWTARSANTYVDNSELIVGGGNNGGLRCDDTSVFNFGTGAFCFELIGKITTSQQAAGIFTSGVTTWGENGVVLRLLDEKMGYVAYPQGPILASTAIPLNQDTHLAWARDESGNLRMFANGVLLSSNSYGYALNFSYLGSVLFGYSWTNTSPIGRFKGVRITKGHARYVSNFTPPSRF